MTTIRLHDSLTRRKRELVPLDPRKLRMYVCGPTVYDRAHLGNARPVVVFDVLFRLLRHVYGPEHVAYVRNVTDVDDKINARAAATGRPIRDITDETLRWFHEDMAALGALPPTQEPRATEWIPSMIEMIERLLARGHAYEVRPPGDATGGGHVLFRVRSFPDYGRLSGRSLDDMIAGARVEVAPWKEDPLDFVLWKPSDAATPGWDSPWGRGRPGWHIECSAMSRALLGESFDIHGGGLDLQFPHHENEIAQSRCAHPEEGFARLWMHNEMLLVDGRKMSKSLGNFFTVRDLLDRGVPGEVIRFVLLGTHYGKPMDWTEVRVQEAKRNLDFLYRAVGNEALVPEVKEVREDVVAALSDDLNTPLALHRLIEFAGRIDPRGGGHSRHEAIVLKRTASLLGLLETTRDGWHEAFAVPADVLRALEGLLAELAMARAARDWPRADRIKAGLAAAGVKVMIRPDKVERELTLDPDREAILALARDVEVTP